LNKKAAREKKRCKKDWVAEIMRIFQMGIIVDIIIMKITPPLYLRTVLRY
jgi:hypothetical protein